MQQKINQHYMGEQMAKIKDLEKKAAQAKEMRDYMAYKQFQKDLERERAMKDKMEFHRQVDDTNRKRDEKERQWRKFYEDFAHQQQGKISDYTQKVIMPYNEKERMMEMKQAKDAQDLNEKYVQGLAQGYGKRAMTQAEIDEFNRHQLELKNKKKQEEMAKNLEYAQNRGAELNMMEDLNGQQRAEFQQQKKLYGQTLQYQQAVQDQLKKNYGKMTDNEKKFNKIDLTVSIE